MKIFKYLSYYKDLLILFLISKIDKFCDKKLTYKDKIIDTVRVDDCDVLVDMLKNDFKPIIAIHKSKPMQTFKFILKSGKSLVCADKHIVYKFNSDGEYSQIFVDNLYVGDKIDTEDGQDIVESVQQFNIKTSMYDISIASENQTYYTNGILSHNTTTTVAFLLWYLTFHVSRNVAIMANKKTTATEIVSKLTNTLYHLPFFLKPGIVNINKNHIVLDNGCQLLSQATTKTAQIGFTIHILFLDEFAHVPVNIVDDFWRSVYPTLSSSLVSQCIISSTPNGIANKYYELWDGAIKNENSFVPYKVLWWQVPGHDENWERQMRLDYGDDEFNQEFNLQFNVSSKLLLNSTDIMFMDRIKQTYSWLELAKSLLDTEVYSPLTWVDGFDPEEDFDRKTTRFLISADLGEGKQSDENKKPDYNVFHVYKIEPCSIAHLRKLRKDQYSIKNMFRFRQVGTYRDNIGGESLCAKVTRDLVFNVLGEDICKISVELNFNGNNYVRIVSKHENYYEDVWVHTYHTKPIPEQKLPPLKIGYKTNNNKDFYCKLTKSIIKDRLLIIDEPVSISEFSTFGRDKKGKYKGIATKDDTVMGHVGVSHFYDTDEYESWLYDLLEDMPDSDFKRMVYDLLDMAEFDDSEVSDDDFNMMYNINNNPYNIFGNDNQINNVGIQNFSWNDIPPHLK